MNTSDPREFRPLNENEKAVIMSAVKKGRVLPTSYLVSCLDYVKVSYEPMQGGFCVCLVCLTFLGGESIQFRKLVWRGASRRSYKDPRKPIKGEMLAFSRAVLYSRPVEI